MSRLAHRATRVVVLALAFGLPLAAAPSPSSQAALATTGHAISGTITDTHGNPVVGACISVGLSTAKPVPASPRSATPQPKDTGAASG